MREVSWYDILSNKLSFSSLFSTHQSNIMDILSQTSRMGSLASDYLRYIPEGKVELIQVLIPYIGTVDIVKAFLHATVYLPDTTSNNTTSKEEVEEEEEELPQTTVDSITTTTNLPYTNSNNNSINANTSNPPPPPPNANTGNSNVNTAELRSQKILMLQEMFPNYGKAFLEICLRFYYDNESEVIEALLHNNLHPHLLVVPKDMEIFQDGKYKNDQSLYAPTTFLHTPHTTTATSNATTTTNPSHSTNSANETVDIFARHQSEEYREQQKKFLRNYEQQQLLDARILAQEYDDDYDDEVTISYYIL
jgi:hypothetical protein